MLHLMVPGRAVSQKNWSLSNAWQILATCLPDMSDRNCLCVLTKILEASDTSAHIAATWWPMWPSLVARMWLASQGFLGDAGFAGFLDYLSGPTSSRSSCRD